jgi:class 3 adenylate cyclase
MCAATHEAVGSAYPVAEARRLRLKGKHATVQSYRIRIG